jgi:hypothetical protein
MTSRLAFPLFMVTVIGGQIGYPGISWAQGAEKRHFTIAAAATSPYYGYGYGYPAYGFGYPVVFGCGHYRRYGFYPPRAYYGGYSPRCYGGRVPRYLPRGYYPRRFYRYRRYW